MTREELVATLNGLIKIAEDGYEDYSWAAQQTDAPDLKALLADLAAERGIMIRELQRHVVEQAAAPETAGTLRAGAHRLILNLRAALAGPDPDAILAEIERGESVAADRFESALARDLPPHVAATVQALRQQIERDRARIAALRTSPEAAPSL